MKKNIFLLALLSIGLVCACSKEEDELVSPQEQTEQELGVAREKASELEYYYVTVTAEDGTTHDSLVIVCERWTFNDNIPYIENEVWYGDSLAIERIYQYPEGYFDNREIPDTATIQ